MKLTRLARTRFARVGRILVSFLKLAVIVPFFIPSPWLSYQVGVYARPSKAKTTTREEK